MGLRGLAKSRFWRRTSHTDVRVRRSIQKFQVDDRAALELVAVARLGSRHRHSLATRLLRRWQEKQARCVCSRDRRIRHSLLLLSSPRAKRNAESSQAPIGERRRIPPKASTVCRIHINWNQVSQASQLPSQLPCREYIQDDEPLRSCDVRSARQHP